METGSTKQVLLSCQLQNVCLDIDLGVLNLISLLIPPVDQEINLTIRVRYLLMLLLPLLLALMRGLILM